MVHAGGWSKGVDRRRCGRAVRNDCKDRHGGVGLAAGISKGFYPDRTPAIGLDRIPARRHAASVLYQGPDLLKHGERATIDSVVARMTASEIRDPHFAALMRATFWRASTSRIWRVPPPRCANRLAKAGAFSACPDPVSSEPFSLLRGARPQF